MHGTRAEKCRFPVFESLRGVSLSPPFFADEPMMGFGRPFPSRLEAGFSREPFPGQVGCFPEDFIR